MFLDTKAVLFLPLYLLSYQMHLLYHQRLFQVLYLHLQLQQSADRADKRQHHRQHRRACPVVKQTEASGSSLNMGTSGGLLCAAKRAGRNSTDSFPWKSIIPGKLLKPIRIVPRHGSYRLQKASHMQTTPLRRLLKNFVIRQSIVVQTNINHGLKV